MGKNRWDAAAVIRRTIQGVVLSLFLFSLWFMPKLQGGDIFVQFDPLAAVVSHLAAREFVSYMAPGLLIVASAFVFGRVFCGYVCPMGTTTDIAGAILRRFAKLGKRKVSERLYAVKYFLLAFVAGAALIGVNLFYWLDPLPLISRFYSVLVQPITTLIGNKILVFGQPVLSMTGSGELEYLQIAVRRFNGIYFILTFFTALFLLELIRARFWCRYLCPAGALLGLCSRAPFWRRRVSKCKSCGACVKRCPMGAIAPDGVFTFHSECTACRTCVARCPSNAVEFSFARRKRINVQEVLPTRRAFLLSACGGAGFAALEFLDLRTLASAVNRGTIYPEAFIRPPGALPEKEFLARCLRCGMCMRVCPTNGLQPATSADGSNLGGMFTPILVARRGQCEPDCNLCGVICPSKAIRALPLKEKRWAKIGASVVIHGRCLAWNNSKSCVVCQEVCPYDAVRIVPRDAAVIYGAVNDLKGKYPVPIVIAEKCFGCGYCEQHCPTEAPAIVTEPLNSLRITEGSYEERGKEQGLQLEVVDKSIKSYEDTFRAEELPRGVLPPGFTD